MFGGGVKKAHRFDCDRAVKGLQRSLWGYFKKAVIADRIGIFVSGVLSDENAEGFVLLWAMIIYSLQIYADFSGGIDVIMGISEILDIRLPENFKAPLVSKSVTEYWQRWHISLGVFMERYLYYPIVLNRRIMRLSKKIPDNYLRKVCPAVSASAAVFVIVGIWHGTGWNYVVYGCYQAVFVTGAVLLGPCYKKWKKNLHIDDSCISWRIFQILRTFLILTAGRYFIRADNLSHAAKLLGRTFQKLSWQGIHVLFDDSLLSYGLDHKNLMLMYMGAVLIILVDVLHERNIHFRELLMKQDIVFRYAVYYALLFGIIIFGVYGPGYDSASFIYQGF